MLKIKTIASVIVALALGITMLTGCNSNTTSSGKKSIVCTIFPQYDWVREILGEKASDYELTLLINNRIDLHSYNPSVEDIAKVSSCELFIYVGGESDGWVEKALKDAKNKNMLTVNLLEELGDKVKLEEFIEGMEEEKHDEEDDDEDDEDEEDEEYDEHVWLSLKNAEFLCKVIADSLKTLDKANEKTYADNLKTYTDKLKALDKEYEGAVSTAKVKTLLFADRFPFRYMVDDYGLDYYAAFIGCSAETEASFETVVFLAKKVDELGLTKVMVTESSDKAIANTVISNTGGKNQKILALDSFQASTTDDIAKGNTYFAVMERNLETLKEALS